MDDLYATLGVAKTASADEIKKAYRKLARVHHPDANAGDPKAEERFKEISHAHDVLADPEKRAEYDARLQFGGRRANGGPAGAGGAGGAGAPASGTSPTCSPTSSATPVRARRAARAEPAPGAAPTSRWRSTSRSTRRWRACRCRSRSRPRWPARTVAAAGPSRAPARACAPTARAGACAVATAGSFAFSEPCPRCGGNGTVIDDPCPTCHGTGSTSTRSQIKVKIPPGVKDGTRVRLKGRGQAGTRGGPAGDLQVITRVAPSRLYTRKGDDLVINVPVTFAEAALGAQVEVPTLDGRVKLTVPSGSADGRSLRIGGKGAPRLKGEGRGDLIATLRVEVPRELSAEAARRPGEVRQARHARSAGDAVLVSGDACS